MTVVRDEHDKDDSLAVLSRLMEAVQAKTESALAAIVGVTHQAVYNAKKKGSIPPSWILGVAKKYDVSADWLFFGRGKMRPESLDALCFPDKAEPGPRSGPKLREVAVVGLASCGLKGWFNTGPVALGCPVAEDSPPGIFAVIAVGQSLVPEGVKQGYVALCDPDRYPEQGDTVFIERHDGAAALKLYLGEDEEWFNLKGYLDPKQDGSQQPYSERLLKSAVCRVATVSSMKIKA